MNEGLRLRRGVILLQLHAQYPLPLARRSLEQTLGMFYEGESRQFLADLQYLEDKALLVKASSNAGRITIDTYTITPAGIDLVDGSTTDPGIEIDRGS